MPFMFPTATRKREADAFAPPQWKMVIASGLAVYPLILFIPPALKPVTAGLPQWIVALSTVVCITPLATFATLPAVTWILQRWLYRGSPKSN